MIQKTILLLLALCLWNSAQAQEEAPVILVASQGKVTYQSPAGKGRQKLTNGAVLQRGGALKLNKSGSTILLSNGHFRRLEGKNTFPLSEQFPDGSNTMISLNFDYTFSNYLNSAIMLAADPNSAGDAWGAIRTDSKSGDGWGAIRSGSGTGDGWGAIRSGSGTGDGWGAVRSGSGSGDGWGTIRSGSGTGDGWGGKGNAIHGVQPFGKVLPGSVQFRWSRPSGNRTYKVTIMDMRGNMLMESTTQDTFLTMDLSQDIFKPGQMYQWRAASNEEPVAVSNTLAFAIGAEKDRAAAIKDAQDSEIYAQSTAAVQGLMQAVALEGSDWYIDAAQQYRSLQNAEPRNELIRLMHAAFWLRYGLKAVAAEVYEE